MATQSLNWTADEARSCFVWRRCFDGGVRIVRVDCGMFGGRAVDGRVSFPRFIGGAPVTEVGPFACGMAGAQAQGAARQSDEPGGVLQVELPEGICRLGDFALAGLRPQFVHLPKSLEKMGRLGLSCLGEDGAVRPIRFEVAEDSAAYRSFKGSLYSGDGKTLLLCAAPYEEDMRLLDSVETIGPEAFAYGSSFPRVLRLPDGVGRIESAPNRGCLWVCAPGSEARSAAQRRGFAVASERFFRANRLVCDVDARGGAVLVGCEGSALHLELPARIEGRPLVGIGAGALPEQLRSVTFPDTVEFIGACELPDVRRVVLPRGLRRVGAKAFSSGGVERRVSIPASCEAVGAGSFLGFDCAFEACGARVFVGSQAAAECFLDAGCEADFAHDSRPGLASCAAGAGEVEAAPRVPFDFERYDKAVLGDRIDREGTYGGAARYAERAARRHAERAKLLSAVLRLAFPYRLGPAAKAEYLRFVNSHVPDLVSYLTDERDQAVLAALVDQRFFSPALASRFLDAFRIARYAPGVAQLLALTRAEGPSSQKVRFAL